MNQLRIEDNGVYGEGGICGCLVLVALAVIVCAIILLVPLP